ncbi:hypothetical protein APUTEX25_002676 [Auxenochlorella protothecoides]|uniref:Uncharacterized protein n=1 Tax=Auxenochlorella protothecoides TaxID=3075 RepID=A0A3M7KW71_AUXPR|nr:hypothetical protein APUTEX25_002676 [Auxenochlorella protothecoides]|eukprot:RMZ54099.1 hypothetical protein APUTEX25_002676 [Auxenochlorella protothecoides]
MDVDVVAADDAPSTSRPLASAGQDSQTPPVPLGVVNKLDDAEKREQQAQNDATVNEWRTAPGEAGTLGRFGKVLGDYTTTSIKTTWNGFRDLFKKKKKKKEKKKKKKGQQQQQQQPVLDALRSTVDDVVAVISESRTVGGLFATFHAIRMVEEFERRKQAGRADADAALQPFDKTFFSRCLTLIWRPREAAGGNAGTGAKAAFAPLAESVALFRETLERAGVTLQPPDLEYIRPLIEEAAGDLATATSMYYKRELLRHLQQNAKLELGALKLLNLEEVHGIPARKKQAIEACLRRKAEEYQVDAEGKRGKKKTGETGEKKTDWFVHVGWAFFALLFNCCRFEGCGWYSAGHWRTNGYSVTVTLRRARGPPRPGDPPPRPPDAPKTSGKRDRGGAPLGAPQGRGIADEFYRRDRPPEDAKIHMYVGIDPGRTKMYTAVDEHANVTSCSSKEFHAMSGAKWREGVIANWHAKAPDYVKKLHQYPTYKTASTAVLLSRVVKIVPDLREGLAWHRDKKPFRKVRHQAYVGRERAITRLAEQFRAPPGMTTIVGVGNWSAQDRGGIMRGAPPRPWIRFLRRMRWVCRVVVVDEHRSSKLCCACHATLHAHQYVRVRNGEEKLVDVWDTKRSRVREAAVQPAQAR